MFKYYIQLYSVKIVLTIQKVSPLQFKLIEPSLLYAQLLLLQIHRQISRWQHFHVIPVPYKFRCKHYHIVTSVLKLVLNSNHHKTATSKGGYFEEQIQEESILRILIIPNVIVYFTVVPTLTRECLISATHGPDFQEFL